MEDVFYETTASGDVLVDVNGTPLAILVEGGGGDGGSGGSGVWKSPVVTVADLPTTGNTVDDIRFVRDELLIYAWDGDSWEIIGLPWDDDGEDPEPLPWKTSVMYVEDLPTTGNASGDLRYVISTKRIYTWNGVEWGPLADNSGGGSGGIGSVEFYSDLEAIEDPAEGDMYLVKSENAIYVWDKTTVDKEDTYSWRMLLAQSGDAKTRLGVEFPWMDGDKVAGGFTVRDVDIQPHNGPITTDPGWVESNFDGLYWYPAGDPVGSPGGYEPWRGPDHYYSGIEARQEDVGVDLGARWSLTVLVDILKTDEWTTTAVTAGNRVGGNNTDEYFYGELNRFSGKFALYHVQTPFNNRTLLAEVYVGVPVAGDRVTLNIARDHDKLNGRCGFASLDGTTHPYTEQTVSYTDGAGGTTFFSNFDAFETHPGIAAQWSKAASLRFVEANFYAYAVRRELALRLNEEDAFGTSQEIILANSDEGWLLYDGSGGGGGGGGGSAHVIEQADGTDLPARRAIRPQEVADNAVARIFTYDDAGGNATRIGVLVDNSALEDKIDKQIVATKGATTGFIALAVAAGYSLPAIEPDEDIPGWRYVASYQFDNGWVNFRGPFNAVGGGAGMIGTLEEEFRPPHVVRGVGVRSDGAVLVVRVEADGKVWVENAQAGTNHLDGFRFYAGKGPVAVVGTFIPDPQNPYFASHKTTTPQRITMKKAGLFEYPRDSDQGKLVVPAFPPVSPAYDNWGLYVGSQVTWLVIDGPDVGQTGVLTLNNGGIVASDNNGVILTIPPGLEGQVRITFTNFYWEEYFAT